MSLIYWQRLIVKLLLLYGLVESDLPMEGALRHLKVYERFGTVYLRPEQFRNLLFLKESIKCEHEGVLEPSDPNVRIKTNDNVCVLHGV